MSSILHRKIAETPALVVRGEGCYLIDEAGKRYLDASGGAAVSCLGHSHPRVIEAIQRQVGTLAFAHTSFFTSEPAERLADRLISLAPEGFAGGRVAFVGSGSEAMEAALKLVRQHFVEAGQSQRSRFIARRMSYHGNTIGALGIGGHPGRRAIYEPLLMKTALISPCHAYRGQEAGESLEAYGLRMANELQTAIEELGPETVAAFIAEPVVGATLGSATAAPGYFKRIREICDKYGVLFIADEVMCGMGRTGTLFASEAEGVTPDIITIAKGLGAGYQPIGALLAKASVIQPIIDGTGQLAHGHTYMSHVVGCAGSLAVLDAFEEEQLIGRVKTQGAVVEELLRSQFGNHPNVGDIRGRGLFWSVELVADRATKRPFDASLNLAGRIKTKAQELGLICYPSSGSADGRNGDHVLVAPPYIVGQSEIDEMIDKLQRAIEPSLTAVAKAA